MINVFDRELFNSLKRRKSFHTFNSGLTISKDELDDIEKFLSTLKPLDESIPFSYKIVDVKETSFNRGGEYAVLFYSKKQGNYLQNIGYIGEQLDLFLTYKNIGSLWCGIAKPKIKQFNGLEYVIMLILRKVNETDFRVNFNNASRKDLKEIWHTDKLIEVAKIVRYSPSACNSQPWIIEEKNNEISVYRYKKNSIIGIMTSIMANYFNRIDIGIFTYILELTMINLGINYKKSYFDDSEKTNENLTLFAKYKLL